ncbi:hypothetical protein ACFLTP_08785 [Chloroflexota bacterium]
MSIIKVKKGEIELCFERFRLDANKEFFPDPFRYKDLRLVHSEIVTKIRKHLAKIMSRNKIPILLCFIMIGISQRAIRLSGKFPLFTRMTLCFSIYKAKLLYAS